jgi:Predicted redox protein, regulator of disulfide bond formation
MEQRKTIKKSSALEYPNKDTLKKVIEKIANGDTQLIESLGKVDAHLFWTGGFRVKGFCKTYEVSFDMPSIVGGSDAYPGPGPTLMASLGACLVIGIVYNSAIRDIKIYKLSVSVSGVKGDPKTFYTGSGGNPGYENIHVIFYVDTDASEDVIRDIIEHSIKTSPVASSLKSKITYELKLLA